MKIVEFLKGKKTYIIAVLMVVLGLMTDNNQMILEGMGFAGLRNALR